MGLFSRIRDIALAALAVIGAIAILALMIHIMSDVVLRNAVNQPVPATYEIVTNYYMVALAFIPLAWLERTGGMVSVEVIDGMLSPRALRISDKLVALISTAIYAALAWVTFEASLKTFASGTFVLAQSIPIPTWPAYFLPPLGFLLAALVTALRLFERQRTHEAS
ncbi:MAG: TRAP transporter small permease [Silicimonas sp.]